MRGCTLDSDPDTRFACDAMLGSLARWLRAAGGLREPGAAGRRPTLAGRHGMKTVIVLVGLGLVAASDPNRLPQEEARGYAKVCVEQAATLTDLQIKTDVDTEKPCAIRGE